MAAITRAHPESLSEAELGAIAMQRSAMLSPRNPTRSSLERDYQHMLDEELRWPGLELLRAQGLTNLATPGSLLQSVARPRIAGDGKAVLAAVAASRPPAGSPSTDVHRWASALESTAMVTDLEERLLRSERARQRAEAQVATLESRLRGLEAENTMLGGALAELNQHERQQGSAMATGVQHIADMARALALAEKRVEERDGEIERLNEALESAPAGELAALRKENATLSAQLQVLSERLMLGGGDASGVGGHDGSSSADAWDGSEPSGGAWIGDAAGDAEEAEAEARIGVAAGCTAPTQRIGRREGSTRMGTPRDPQGPPMGTPRDPQGPPMRMGSPRDPPGGSLARVPMPHYMMEADPYVTPRAQAKGQLPPHSASKAIGTSAHFPQRRPLPTSPGLQPKPGFVFARR